jgi:hypothetical protein
MRAKRYTTPRDNRRKNGPVLRVKPDLGVWRAALRLAEGDASRLHVEPDGTVTVRNRGNRKPNSPFQEEL